MLVGHLELPWKAVPVMELCRGEVDEFMHAKNTEGWVTTPEEESRLYYIQRGSGPCVVFCNGIGVAASSFWAKISRALSKFYCTLNWDYRGHGRSSAPEHPERLGIGTCAEDLARVMDQLGIEQAVVAGHSMGVQVAFEFYRRFPERVLGLIPTLGSYQRPFDTFMRFRRSPQLFRVVSEFVLRHPSIAERVWPHLFDIRAAKLLSRWIPLTHPTLFPHAELDFYLSHMSSISPVVFFHLARHMQSHSADEILEEIDVPCLIFAGENDLFTPLELSVEMYQRIPQAEFQLIRHGSHGALAEQPDLFWLRMQLFLQTNFPEFSLPESHNPATANP